MTRLPREPLDADERALAARLPRMHGRDEPDAALDARILAAAHAALSPVPVAKRRRGWIVPLTAAASVSLAVGLAWQLQPLPAPQASSASATVAAESAAGDNDQRFMDQVDAPTTPSASVVQDRPMPMVAPARQQTVPTGDAARIAREAVPAEPAAESTAATPMFVPSPPPASMADVMPVDVAAPPPAPPAPPAPVSVQGAMARSSAADVGATAAGAPLPTQAKRARNEAEAAATLDTVTSEGFAKAVDEEDVPPATMDAPAARDAWLKRIAELQQQGRIDDARASLAEFRRRYPDAVLPPELRKLEP